MDNQTLLYGGLTLLAAALGSVSLVFMFSSRIKQRASRNDEYLSSLFYDSRASFREERAASLTNPSVRPTHVAHSERDSSFLLSRCVHILTDPHI